MELRAQVAIGSPAHTAWAVLGEHFGQIGEWASPITSSCVEGEPAVGAIRTCQIAGFGPFKAGTIKERLVKFRSRGDVAGLRELRRDAELRPERDQPWPVHPETEATCLVRIHATLELRGPLRLLQFLLEGRLQAHGGDCDVSGCCRVEGDAHLPCLPAVSFET
jgi:hypothetical protein